jgi:ABC-type hemin transport system ATPase subunit
MARGWESKSIEAQQEEASQHNQTDKPRLTREAADRLRAKESLRLSLNRVLQQLENNSDARRRTMLEEARSDLQRKLEELA